MSNTPEPTVDLAAEKYVSLTTFTKDGRAKPTPVWIVGLADGKLGFNTAGGSWKAKRLANTAKVTLRSSDARGRVADGATEVAATAVVSKERHDEVGALIKSKYGFMYYIGMTRAKVMGWFSKSDEGDPVAVIITVDG